VRGAEGTFLGAARTPGEVEPVGDDGVSSGPLEGKVPGHKSSVEKAELKGSSYLPKGWQRNGLGGKKKNPAARTFRKKKGGKSIQKPTACWEAGASEKQF